MNIKKNMYIRTTLIFLFLFLFLLKFYIPLGLRSIISYSFLFIIFLVIFSGKIIYNKIPKNYFYVNEQIFLIIFYGINIFLFILYIMMANSFKQKDELISFENNRPFIYQYIANSINSNNYQDAIDESKKYRKFNDVNIINYQKIAEKRKANLEKAEILKNKELKKQDAIQKAIIEKENKEKALKESIEMEKRMDEINIQKEKKTHFQYLKNSEQKWINIIKDDEKTNVSFVIKDMAQAYSGLMELYPNNQHYKQRGKYWIDSNNEEIQHQNNIDRVYNKNILTMEKYLKTHLNNPRSLEIVSEKYYDHIDEVTIEIIYRATNSYNAIITDRMLTRFNLKTGKVVSASLSSLNE